MLDGTCLSEALENLQDIPQVTNDSDDDDDSGDLDAEKDQEDGDNGEDLDANEDEEGTGPVAGSTRLSKVTLAQKRGEALPLVS
jgi:hypothetical protein